jgi:hypothetical protein
MWLVGRSPSGLHRDPNEWKTGDEPMTAGTALVSRDALRLRGDDMAKKAAKGTKKKAAKRTLIDTRTDKRFVRRSAPGRFKESDDVGKSLAVDRRKRAKRKVKSGQGDRGDR